VKALQLAPLSLKVLQTHGGVAVETRIHTPTHHWPPPTYRKVIALPAASE
jgi:hypothetical protein